MKPIQLTMTAFGPYKQQELIDFTELQEHRLFSISGNTGAGKTTIFDAICYALYGEASGEERNDASMLRSHFADDDVYTSVSLTFQIKGKTYHIMRQMGHRKKGNKTATGGSVEFYEVVDEQHIPCVDRFHVTDINKKVEDVIGLTKHQFSQIVMLPQGEFRKLLTSETENKEEILRRIFKTDRYKLIRDILDQKRKGLKDKLQEKQKEREIYFRNAFQLPIREDSVLEKLKQQEQVNSYQVTEALEEEIYHYEMQMKSVERDEAEQHRLLSQKQELFHQAQAVNERFEQLRAKEKEHAALLEQKSQMKEQEDRLRLAEEANRLTPFEDWYKEAVKAADLAERDLAAAARKKEQIKEQYQQAKIRFTQEKEREYVREETKRKVQALQDLQPVVETLALRKQQLTETTCYVADEKNKLQSLEQQLQASLHEKRSLLEVYQKLEESLRQYVTKVNELHHMREDAKVLVQYKKALQELQQSEEEWLQAKAAKQQAEEQYNKMEQLWLSEQAGQLAVHLHDGMPCPVCGSAEHPNKAIARTIDVNEKQITDLRNHKMETETAYFRAEQKYHFHQAQCKETEKEAIERGYDTARFEEEYTKLVQNGKQLDTEVKALQESEVKRNELQPRLKDLEKEVEIQTQQKQQLEAKLHSLQMEEMQQRISYENDQKKLPDAIVSLVAWQQHMTKVQAELRHLEQSWKEAGEQHEYFSNEHIRIEAECSSLKREWEKAEVQKREKYETFQSSLQNAGFAEQEAYESAKLSEEQRLSLKQAIQAYYASMEVLSKQIEELQQALHDKKWTQLEELMLDIQDMQHLVKKLMEQRQSMKGILETIQRLRASIAKIDGQIREEEAVYQELVDLYEVVKGDNESRVSFERYILIEYLEQIVQAANERLRRLSNGQFFLKRSERVEKRNRQSGLGLDVYDTYTGQTRDVKTLSGGEKFNASLSLALGMADIIQAYEGGISIETMFIDEGFGSLDEESLTKAIDTLIDLQKSGRLIGVISHVQELKNTLPAALEVTKQKDGSSKTKFILK
ncbi:AAA family ATPase [Ectobacillus panaciterrae]|uniref:AAA family ATPase n=1 Tax=Ectobacillus panaciterrae TaxID=363872 RepID=UPI00041869EF|nr:SMC family ATPase [Ectobacillus panaciterrae]